jgi:hypothetical protein
MGDGKTWPQLLSGTIIDKSKTGQSNQAIVRSTINDIITAPVPPDKVIIQFTVLERFDLPYHDIGWKTHYPLSEQKGPPTRMRPLFEDYCPPSDSQDHLPLLTRRLLSAELCGNILMLQSFLQDWDIDYYFMVWPDLVANSVGYRLLNHDKILFRVWQMLKSKGFRASFKPDPERDGKIDHHFGPDAHQQIADWVTKMPLINEARSNSKMPIHGYD